jgi:Tol biopolymer transport system component
VASGALGGICVGEESTAGGEPPICDPAKPFGTPVLVEGVASSAEDASMRLSPDEKTAYFFSARSGTKLLYTANRASATAAFGNVAILANVNTDNQYNPAITADGLTLFFASYRAGGVGDNDIYQATRSSLTGDFSQTRLAPNVNTSASEVQPYVTRDGTTMYFVRTIPGAGDTVFSAVGSATRGFTNPAAVPELDGPTNDSDPVLSADGLTVFWSTDRPGGQGDLDVWDAHRTSLTEPFSDLAPVSSVNSTAFDSPSDISSDGCRLYMTSIRVGRTAIYVATRPP